MLSLPFATKKPGDRKPLPFQAEKSLLNNSALCRDVAGCSPEFAEARPLPAQ